MRVDVEALISADAEANPPILEAQPGEYAGLLLRELAEPPPDTGERDMTGEVVGP